jgi:hypothetical protein
MECIITSADLVNLHTNGLCVFDGFRAYMDECKNCDNKKAKVKSKKK